MEDEFDINQYDLSDPETRQYIEGQLDLADPETKKWWDSTAPKTDKNPSPTETSSVQSEPTVRNPWNRFKDLLTKTAVSGPLGTLALYGQDWLDSGKMALKQRFPGQSEDWYEKTTDDILAQNYRNTVAEYEERGKNDPAWKADDSFLNNLGRTAVNVLGSVAGSASPIDFVAPGATRAIRVGRAAALNAGEEAVNETLQGERGVRDQFSPADIAGAGVLGGAFQGALEGAGSLARRLTGDVEPTSGPTQKELQGAERLQYEFNRGADADTLMAMAKEQGLTLDRDELQTLIDYRENVGPGAQIRAPDSEETRPTFGTAEPSETPATSRTEIPKDYKFDLPEDPGAVTPEHSEYIRNILETSKDVPQAYRRLFKYSPDDLKPILGRISKRMEELQNTHGFKFKGVLESEGFNNLGEAHLDPATRELEIRLQDNPEAGLGTGLSFPVVVHEGVHAVTVAAVNAGRKAKRGTKLRASVDRLDELHSTVRRALGDEFSQVNNADELLAYGLSDRNFQERLKQIQISPTRTMFDRFVEVVRDLLGLSKEDSSALSHVIQSFHELTSPDADRVLSGAMNRQFGPKMDYAPVTRQMEKPSIVPPKKGDRLRLRSTELTAPPKEVAGTFLNELGVYFPGELRKMSSDEVINAAEKLGIDQDWLDYFNDRRLGIKTPQPDMSKYLPSVNFGSISRQMAAQGPTTGRAGNINLDRLRTDEEMDDILQDIANDIPRNAPQSHRDIEALANWFGENVEDLVNHNPRLEDLPGYATAIRGALTDKAAELKEFGMRWTEGDHRPEVREQAENAYAELVTLASRATNLANISGRTLGSFNIQAGRVRDLAAFQKIVGDEKNFDRMMAMVAENGDNPAAINRLVKDSLKPKFEDLLFSGWYNFLLSGLGTHFKNIVGNTSNTMAELFSHGLAYAIGTPRALIKGDRSQFSELKARFIGSAMGVQNAFKTVDGMDYSRVVEAFRRGNPLDNVARNKEQVTALPPGALSYFVEGPTRSMAAQDEFFRNVNGLSELYAQAARIADREGHTGKNFGLRMAELVNDPTEEMTKAANEAALRLAFRDKPMGITRAIMDLKTRREGDNLFIRTARGALRVLIPFDRTPDSLFRTAIRYSPLGFLDRYNQADWASGPRGKDLVLARIGLGTSLATWAGLKVAEGNLSGAGPSSYEKKQELEASGWRANSIKIGDHWVSYEGYEPFSSILGATATAIERGETAEEGKAAEVALGLANAMTNSFWLENLGGLFKALDETKGVGALNVWLANMAGGLTAPAIVRQANQNLVDTTVRNTTGTGTLEDRVRGSMQSPWPGASEDLPARHDVYGRERTRPGGILGFVTGIQPNPLDQDPTVQELQRLAKISPKVLIGPVDRGDLKDTITSRPVSAEDVEAYQALSGRYILETLREETQQPEWQEMDDGAKWDRVKKVARDMRKFAREDLFSGEQQEEVAPWEEQ